MALGGRKRKYNLRETCPLMWPPPPPSALFWGIIFIILNLWRKVYRNRAQQLLSVLLALAAERSNVSVHFPKYIIWLTFVSSTPPPFIGDMSPKKQIFFTSTLYTKRGSIIILDYTEWNLLYYNTTSIILTRTKSSCTDETIVHGFCTYSPFHNPLPLFGAMYNEWR